MARVLGRSSFRLAALLVVLAAACPAGASPVADEPPVNERFREISDLRSRGDFDAAIAALTVMIDDFARSDDVLRRAYNQLVWTIVTKSDDVNERARITPDPTAATELHAELDTLVADLGRVVGAALTRFPDLRAGDDVPDPSRVNQTYEPARQRMFGNLQVETTPDSAAVWINDPARGWVHEGFTPLRRALFPIGTYEIRLAHDGFKETTFTTQIAPSESKHHEVPLVRTRSRRWWLTRVVAPVATVVGAVTYVLVAGDDGGAAEPDPLSGPPAPPPQ